jgi:hypothetical protein
MLADIAHEMEESTAEKQHLLAAWACLQPLGDKWGMARWCESSARRALAHSDPLATTRLLGAADALRDAGGSRRAEVELDRNHTVRTTLESQLGSNPYHAALAEGREMTQDTKDLLSLLA